MTIATVHRRVAPDFEGDLGNAGRMAPHFKLGDGTAPVDLLWTAGASTRHPKLEALPG